MAADAHRQRGRILIVDDESNARAALSEILHEEGYATETAADGFKALGKLDEFAPDVILTDLKMPGLDGIAFMEKARTAAPGTVFVVMTAFGTISSAVEAMKKGAENYLLKPLDPEALGAVVERAMEKARLVQEARRAARPAARAQRLQPHRVGRPEDGSRPRARRAGRARAGRACSSRARAARARSSSPRPSTSPPRARRRRSSACTARRSASRSSRASCSATSAARSPGAVGRREGRFKQADGGTLFLDEIRRDLRGGAGQAPALPAGEDVRARRRQRDAQGRRPRHRRDEPRPASPRSSGARSGRTSSTGSTW